MLPGGQGISEGMRPEEPEVHTRLCYDRHRRVPLINHHLDPRGTPAAFYQARDRELGNLVDQAYRAETRTGEDCIEMTLSHDGAAWGRETCFAVRVERMIKVRTGYRKFSIPYRVTNLEDMPVNLRFRSSLTGAS